MVLHRSILTKLFDSFQHRLVKEIVHDNFKEPYRFQAAAIENLQYAAEAYLISYFEVCNEFVVHRNHVTLMLKEMELMNKLTNKYHLSFRNYNN